MKTYLTTLMMISGMALADHVEPAGGNNVLIRFDEPVVPLSVCQNAGNPAATDTDKGLDLFDVKGDDQHKPTAKWVRQDVLRLEFAKGTSCTTEYRLTFQPGRGKYLSDKPMPNTSFTFRHAPVTLEGGPIPGMAPGSFLVFPEDATTVEAQTLSKDSSPAFTYHKWLSDKATVRIPGGPTVPAKVSPARLKHVCSEDYLEQWAEFHPEWEGLTPESILPNALLVEPSIPLPAGTTWTLHHSATPGFRDGDVSTFNVEPDIPTKVKVSYKEGSKCLVLKVLIDAPVTEAEALRVLKAMSVEADGAKASATPDGKGKTLTVNGKECRFTFAEFIPAELGIYAKTERGELSTFTPPGLAVGYVLDIEGEVPPMVDITLPEGITAALGQRSTKAHRCRMSLNPAEPKWTPKGSIYSSDGLSACVLPLKGDHKVRLDTTNVDSITVEAYLLDAETVVTHQKQIREYSGKNEKEKREEAVRTATRAKILAEDPEAIPPSEHKKIRQLHKADKKLMAEACQKQEEPFTPGFPFKSAYKQTIPIPSAPGTYLHMSETVIDLDAVVGGKAQAGVYLARITWHSTPAVRRLLSTLGLPENLLDTTETGLFHVTDLNPILSQDFLLLTRLSDGQAVPDAKVTRYTPSYTHGREKDAKTAPMRDGFLHVDGAFPDRREADLYLVEAGDDYTLVAMEDKGAEPKRHAAFLQTDRPIYIPGDTVHVRALLRQKSIIGKASLPETDSVILQVTGPDDKELLKRSVPLDASGGIDESFTLPAGEEDVTGTYEVEVKTADGRYHESETINVQVFRRNAFTVDASLDIADIRPTEMTAHLHAQDYNGTPLARGKAQVDIESDVPLLTINGLPADSMRAAAPAAEDETSAARVEEDEEDDVDVEEDDDEEDDVVVLSKAPARRSDSKHRYTCNITLDDQGRADIKATFDTFPEDGSQCNICISGSVANDREEHVSIEQISRYVASAPFRLKVDVLELVISTENVEGTGVSIPSSFHADLTYEESTKETLPSGFTFQHTRIATIPGGDIAVVPDTAGRVRYDFSHLLRSLKDKEPEWKACNPHLLVTWKDAEGRIAKKSLELLLGLVDDEDLEDKTEVGFKLDTTETAQFDCTVKSPRAGQAFLILADEFGALRHFTHTVQEGEQNFGLSTDGMQGDVRAVAVLPIADAAGTFSRVVCEQASTSLPSPYQLQTDLTVPDKPARPGATVTLAGQVTKDGKGMPATVTLYAVDAGMLPDAEDSWCDDALLNILTGGIWKADTHSGFSPDIELLTSWEKNRFTDVTMMPCVWHAGELPNLHVNSPWHGGYFGEEDDCDYDEECDDEGADSTPGIVTGGNGEEDECTRDAPAPVIMNKVEQTFSAYTPRLRVRKDFRALAVWKGTLKTDAEGRFSTEAVLPDTLTTYKVFALVAGDDGQSFGGAHAEFTVNQPVMLTPGTPFFMSTGDTLRLPLTVTNNTDQEGTWSVNVSSAKEPQEVTIPARGTSTVYFEVTATDEGTSTLEWKAVPVEAADAQDTQAGGEPAGDAVQGTFPVRFPAPLLKEYHHLALQAGQEKKLAELVSPELAQSARGEVAVHLSANPLIHLAGCMDYLLTYPYGCTEQTSSGLLPWLLHKRIAQLNQGLAKTTDAEVDKVVAETVEKLFKRQLKDGALGYWDDSKEACSWASAHAALVLTIAQEQGYGDCIPKDKMEKLRASMRIYLANIRKDKKLWRATSPMTLFSLGRVLGDKDAMEEGLKRAASPAEKALRFGWDDDIKEDLLFIRALRSNPKGKQTAFLKWMRSRGHDPRHTTTLQSAWMFIALQEYLRLTPDSSVESVAQLQEGSSISLNRGVTTVSLPLQGKPLSQLPAVLKAQRGEVFATVAIKAQPDKSEYPGVTEKGLQVTRIYEKKGADGIWREAKEFATGDVVRITLTCAKGSRSMEYLVLEDYLPSCMEAINPAVPGQTAGLEDTPWSRWFDHKEYLADRVRGFCTRWYGDTTVNMIYYARVKRAGTTTAPPAHAQLMYEPQTYGLSPNSVIRSK